MPTPENRTLPERILSELKRRGAALCTIESCTGGRIAARLTAIPGASDSYWGGFVSYDNSAKIRMAEVPAATLRDAGAVSEDTARSLAEGALRQLSQALEGPEAGIRASRRIAVSTTGIAGPTGGRPGKPVGLCYVAIADSHGKTEVSRVQADTGRADTAPSDTAMTRDEIQEWFADQALRMVLARLGDSSDTL